MHELASQGASMLIIRKYIGPAAAIMPARLGSKSHKRSGSPLTQLSPKICVREKGAAKIHRARGAAHNHTSAEGVFYACLKMFLALSGLL
jgi:hypothetical protein